MSLKDAQDSVRQFMVQAGQATPPSPRWPDNVTMELRVRLVAEELQELAEASAVFFQYTTATEASRYKINEPSITGVADAIADLLVVVLGAAVAYGIDIAPVFDEVMQANMHKFGPGGRRREDGKWLKGPDWQPPDIERILQEQMD